MAKPSPLEQIRAGIAEASIPHGVPRCVPGSRVPAKVVPADLRKLVLLWDQP